MHNSNQTDLVFDSSQEILVQGETNTKLPDNLYIPPDALRVVLDSFSGPLDLLLYLIRRQNIDILNIPIAKITEQYMQYVNLMHQTNLELASEYLLMAAILAEIKSRMMLPRPINDDEDEEDPRAELIRRLQEYERFKKAADQIDKIPRMEREQLEVQVEPPDKATTPLPELTLKSLLFSFVEVTKRASLFDNHQVNKEPLSVRERMITVLDAIRKTKSTQFSNLFTVEEGRSGVVVTLLAILELIKEQLIDIVQSNNYSEIYIKVRSNNER